MRSDHRSRLLADAGNKPTALTLDEENGVQARHRRPVGRCDERAPLLLGDIWAQEPDRLDFKRDLHAIARGGCIGKTLLDSAQPAIAIAVGLDDLRVLGEHGHQGLAVPFLIYNYIHIVDCADCGFIRGSRRAGRFRRRGLGAGLRACLANANPSAQTGYSPSTIKTASGTTSRIASRDKM